MKNIIGQEKEIHMFQNIHKNAFGSLESLSQDRKSVV